MRLCRLILPNWKLEQGSKQRKVIEGEFTSVEIKRYNLAGYNVYYLPNHPSHYDGSATVDGSYINVFSYVFVDCDLKDDIYPSKEAFIEAVAEKEIPPSKVVDSGNGIHVYWKISNLDAMSYLRFQRRLTRLYSTDEAVGQIFQLMRLPGTINTKKQDNQVKCETLFESDISYTAEELDKLLPGITKEDEEYCQQHYNRTYNMSKEQVEITDVMPEKWGKLLQDSQEAKSLWSGNTDDRSRSDYRLGHIMYASGFTRQESMAVLMNSAKALERAPMHRVSYAENIVDKIWTFEQTSETKGLSMSVRDILERSLEEGSGTPLRCHPRIDNTERGFRLGDVIGLVAGAGVGKTAFTLNLFRWFAQENPDYHHMFISLEQPEKEIAERWKTMCGDDHSLHDKVHIIGNYDKDHTFRHLSLAEIQEYIQEFQKKHKLGCVVIDHIGVLKKKGADDDKQDLISICHSMKPFAVQTNTLLVMQSQTSREKAGIGDIELNKDAAYGTSTFEWYVDYLITLWQPLKRCSGEEDCPTVTAFKFCKIRHKKVKKDVIKEDTQYYVYFDSETEQLRDMTQQEEVAFDHYLSVATNKRRSAMRRDEIIPYQSVKWSGNEGTKTNNNRQS